MFSSRVALVERLRKLELGVLLRRALSLRNCACETLATNRRDPWGIEVRRGARRSRLAWRTISTFVNTVVSVSALHEWGVFYSKGVFCRSSVSGAADPRKQLVYAGRALLD